MDKNLVWESKMEQISKEMEEYAKNYKCKICKEQPEFAWCKHLLRNRANKFRSRIREADTELIAN